MSLPQEVVDKFENAPTIYFVCSGNIIRSSYAELFARHLGLKNVDSYGTTYKNTRIHRKSKEELMKRGVDSEVIESFRPTHLDAISSFHASDLHIVMTNGHRDDLINRGVNPIQIIKIRSLVGQQGDLADPYFSGSYHEAYQTITDAVTQIASLLS